MLILGIETSTPQIGVAIGGHEGVLASTHAARGRRHAESLAPAIEFLCEQAEIDIDDAQAEKVGEMAVADPSSGTNPIEFSASDYSEIFKKAVRGDKSA